MPHFRNEDDMITAMGSIPHVKGHVRPPTTLTKVQRKKWVPMPAYEWPCGCTAMPGKRDRGDYYVTVAPECSDHQDVQGNFVEPDPPS